MGGITRGDERVRIVELPRIAVGRTPQQRHPRAAWNGGVADAVGGLRRAVETLNRRRETQLFLDRAADERVGILPDELELSGVFRESEEHGAEQVSGGLVAGQQ